MALLQLMLDRSTDIAEVEHAYWTCVNAGVPATVTRDAELAMRDFHVLALVQHFERNMAMYSELEELIPEADRHKSRGALALAVTIQSVGTAALHLQSWLLVFNFAVDSVS